MKQHILHHLKGFISVVMAAAGWFCQFCHLQLLSCLELVMIFFWIKVLTSVGAGV
jgi:hypothetical protein